MSSKPEITELNEFTIVNNSTKEFYYPSGISDEFLMFKLAQEIKYTLKKHEDMYIYYRRKNIVPAFKIINDVYGGYIEYEAYTDDIKFRVRRIGNTLEIIDL